jgi:enoyl-CoA hydratase/carnithine racemase
MGYRHLRIERDHHVAVVTLDRPENLNALSAGLMNEIIDAARGFHTDEETRVVIFTGAGPCFSAGVDLTDSKGFGRMESASALMISRLLQSAPHGPFAVFSHE